MSLGAGELFIVAIVALIVLGPDKLPTAARSLAKFYKEIRNLSQSVRSQVEEALDLDESNKKAPPGPSGANPANPDVTGFRFVDSEPVPYQPPIPPIPADPPIVDEKSTHSETPLRPDDNAPDMPADDPSKRA